MLIGCGFNKTVICKVTLILALVGQTRSSLKRLSRGFFGKSARKLVFCLCLDEVLVSHVIDSSLYRIVWIMG